ncbi:ArsA family ATPase [Bradyrhizobium sp. SRS-191]|uniref:ArsA family ATPase n=1 Tax=Bradyrhizobium sp. SRS-191 TaxID=2962606 RepID=UPI00211E0AC6|nr:ArsA family ATPase [Bradyrhizobium sp. SRS-191]
MTGTEPSRTKPRIIMVSGKGGVGKTTVAAATAVALAARGRKTIVMSFDLAHSLADSFNMSEELFSTARGQPVKVRDNLDFQEIDVQEEMQRNWGDVYKYIAYLLMGGGLDGIVAEEAAIMPGMEDIIALLHINQYAREGAYDVIVVDCPPTSESLRFVSIIGSIDWYVRKRLKIDRRVASVLRPIAKKFGGESMMLPEDGYFAALQSLFEKLEGVETMLHDPTITSLRLVTVPDQMVVRETQRAYMYFNLYGIAIDTVVVNRMLPKGDGYFSHWVERQTAMIETVHSYFDPVPIATIPFQRSEVIGVERLEEFGSQLYGDADPAEVRISTAPFGFAKISDNEHRLSVQLRFAPKDKVEISRDNEDLFIRIGTFKRVILLPRALVAMQTAGAKMNGDALEITFRKDAHS